MIFTAELQIVLARRRLQQIALLLDGGELRIALIGDEVKQRIAHALIGNLQDGLPFRAAGVVAEFDVVAIDRAELHLEVVVAELRGIETDILLPLAEIVRPVVKCVDSRHNPSP